MKKILILAAALLSVAACDKDSNYNDRYGDKAVIPPQGKALRVMTYNIYGARATSPDNAADLDAIAEAKKRISDRPVLAGVIGPFSLTGRLVDVTEAMIYCYDEPDMMHEVLGKAAAFLTDYVRAYKERGANGVVIAEPLAGLLSPDLEREFSAPYVKQIIDAVQDENFLVIYHNCGDKVVYMADSLFGLGAGAYHFGNAIDIEDMLKKAPEGTVIMGNIDPAGQFRNGTPESIRKATLDLLERCAKWPNFVISSGCDIPPLSKWENIDAYFGAVADFYRNK